MSHSKKSKHKGFLMPNMLVLSRNEGAMTWTVSRVVLKQKVDAKCVNFYHKIKVRVCDLLAPIEFQS